MGFLFDMYDKPLYNTSMDQKDMARMGGLAVKTKYGSEYFKELRKKRVNYQRRHKTDIVCPIDNNGKP